MATGNVIVNVADVGQGQCTFVEIYNTDSTPKLVQTLLFDCGTDKRSDETENNLQYIADKVMSMTTPAFDCIFFSHSDNDHISLTARLLELCGTSPKPKIKKVIYGGNFDQYEKDGENILNTIVDDGYCDKKQVISPKTYHSNYDPDKSKYTGALWTSTDDSVKVHSLACNVLSSRGKWKSGDAVPTRKTAIAKNMVSLVAGLYYGDVCYVICGDATNGTMGAIAKRMNGAVVFSRTAMTTLPHHGSRTTGLSVSSAKRAGANAVRVVESFADLLKAKTITVSAYALHSHPSLELINMFIPTYTSPILRDERLEKKNSHYITANLDIELSIVSSGRGKKRAKSYVGRTQKDTSFEISNNTFTTRYYDPTETEYGYDLGDTDVKTAEGVVSTAGPINGFASWKYTTDSGKMTQIVGYTHLGAASFTTAPAAAASQFSTRKVRTAPAAPRASAPVPPLHRKNLRQFH